MDLFLSHFHSRFQCECLGVYTHMCVYITHVGVRGGLMGIAFSFYCVGLWDIRLDSMHLYLMSHLMGPKVGFK